MLCIAMTMCLFALPQINHAAPLTLNKTEIASAPLTGGYVVVVTQYQTIEVDLPFAPERSAVTVKILDRRGNAIYRNRTNGNHVTIPDSILESGGSLTLVVIQAGSIIAVEPIKG